MKDEAKKRLERLLEGLQEIEEASSASIECDVISSTLEVPLHDTAAWQWIADVVRETRLEQNLKNRIVVVEVKPVVVEPSPGGKSCICWRGDPVKRDKFKAWLDRLSGFFGSYSEVVPNTKPDYGVEGGLQSLCAIAKKEDLSPNIKPRRFLNLAAKTKAKALPSRQVKLFGEVFLKEREIPKRLEKIDPKPSFDVLEIDGSVPRLAKMVLYQLLGKPLRDPPVAVDVEKSEVIVHGKTYPVDRLVVQIIDQLLKANGNPITRKTMQKNCPLLAEYERLDREIAKISELLPLNIESSKSGYRLPPDWLA